LGLGEGKEEKKRTQQGRVGSREGGQYTTTTTRELRPVKRGERKFWNPRQANGFAEERLKTYALAGKIKKELEEKTREDLSGAVDKNQNGTDRGEVSS